jgi:type IV secretion system protein VirB6
MTITVFSDITAQIDALTATFVTTTSGLVISTITPIIEACLIITFMVYGGAIALGRIDSPWSDFLWRSFKIACIVSIGLSAGSYASTIGNIITTTPDAVASAILGDPAQGAKVTSLADTAAQNGFDLAGKAFEKGGVMSEKGMSLIAFGVLVVLSTAILTAVGGAFIILAELMLAILAAVGPFFIVALIFKPTQQLFEKWLGHIIGFGLLIVMMSAVFGLFMALYSTLAANINLDGSTNLPEDLGDMLVVSIIGLIAFLQMPGLAASLGGGISMGLSKGAKQLSGGLSSVGNAAMAAPAAGGRAAGAVMGRFQGSAGAGGGRGGSEGAPKGRAGGSSA